MTNFAGLWRSQGLAAAEARRLRCCALHRGASDAGHGLARGDPGQAGAHDDQRQGRAVPAGSREPPVPGAAAERAVGLGLHLRRHLDRLRLRRLRDRRLCPPDRGLAGQRTAHAGFVLDALEQALHDRRPVHRGGLVHHSDRGSQYVSIKYTERLAEAGIEPRSAASATATTTPSPKRSMASTRPRSSIDAGHGETSKPSSSQPWNGSTGSTTAGCWSPSATSRQPKPRNAITPSWKSQPWRHITQTKWPPENPGRFTAADVLRLAAPRTLSMLVLPALPMGHEASHGNLEQCPYATIPSIWSFPPGISQPNGSVPPHGLQESMQPRAMLP